MPVRKSSIRKMPLTKKPRQTKPVKPALLKFIPDRLYNLKNLIVIGLILLAVVFWGLKKYLIVATVNGQPISRFELSNRLNSQFGQSVLDQLINERLLLGAARQKGIFITADEIDNRIKEIEKSLNGQMSLDQALSMQGLNRNTFRRQLELQLSIEKMFDKDATVSASEIDDYLQNSQDMFPDASDPAKLREEVTSYIKQQKIGKLYEDWFNNLKKDAKITTNL